MKKIYTIVTQQTMTKSFYGDANQQLFENRKEAVYFPLTAYLSTIISEEENFTVLALDSFDSVESHKNYELLKEELEAYYPGHVNVEKIDASFEHNQAGQIKTFNKLYKTFEENDDVYFDVTFGLRPIPMTVFVACNYAKKLLKNVNICNIIYAHYQFGKDDSFVHSIVDITSLFLLNNLIDSLSESKNPNPDYIINLFFNQMDNSYYPTEELHDLAKKLFELTKQYKEYYKKNNNEQLEITFQRMAQPLVILANNYYIRKYKTNSDDADDIFGEIMAQLVEGIEK